MELIHERKRREVLINNFKSNYKIACVIKAKQNMSWCSRRGKDHAGGVSEEARLGGKGERGAQSSGRSSVQEAICMENLSSDRLGVSLGKKVTRGGHRGWQGPCGRMSLLHEQWVPKKVFKLGDDQMISAL